ncbi:MAG TPA: GTPase domain-containing protein [Thermoanaerobaculia bacterium]|nr:GTPase domain-containing protein [Thermoanaerobaculia bacterium]
MVLFNHATREMTAKIVYYGPGLCGKTTNLMIIFDKLDPKSRGKMLSLATKTDRTLFFDLLPVDIGKIGAFNLKIQLYTVPGQVFYNETRKLVLRGADAVVFVVDSQPTMVDSNRESFANLLENLQENDIDSTDIPIVIQYNKRDIPGVLSVEELEEQLGFDGYPSKEASAIKGEGVMETFTLVSKVTAKHLIARLQGKTTPKRDKEKKKAKKSSKAEPELAPTPEPELPFPAPADDPFAGSIIPEDASPFGDLPFDSEYEKVEEVSLEELLEGRDRPNLSDEIPVAVSIDEDIEPIDAEHLLPDEGGVAVAAGRAPSRSGRAAVEADSDLRGEIVSLRADIEALRREMVGLKEALRKGLGI